MREARTFGSQRCDLFQFASKFGEIEGFAARLVAIIWQKRDRLLLAATLRIRTPSLATSGSLNRQIREQAIATRLLQETTETRIDWFPHATLGLF